MRQTGVTPTLSPSMDIQISSNFERFLFELLDRDGDQINHLMGKFAENGEFTVSPQKLETAREIFSAHRLDDKDTERLMAKLYAQTGEVVDPHSIIGVAAAQRHGEAGVPTIALGTAHPAKFNQAVKQAIGLEAPLASPDATYP